MTTNTPKNPQPMSVDWGFGVSCVAHCLITYIIAFSF